MSTAAATRCRGRSSSALRSFRIDLAEVGDGGTILRLDAGKRGARASAQHELSIDEQRVRRTIDQRHAVGGPLEHHPRVADGPAQQLPRAQFVRDRDSREAYAHARSALVDGDGVPVFDADDAHHRRLGAKREENQSCDDEDDFSHASFGPEEGRRTGRVERGE
jgi:hypothetical protein